MSTPKKKPAKPAPETTLSMTDTQPAPSPDSPPLFDRIFSIDPALIDLAPELAAVPMMGAVAAHYLGGKTKSQEVGQEIHDELKALFASLDEVGIKEALKVTQQPNGRWKLWDGRHRLLWASQMCRSVVPAIGVTEEEGRSIIEATVVGRRHWTKGQRAYLGVLLHPEVASNEAHRPKKVQSVNLSMDELALRVGVSVGLVHQAVELYRLFYAPGHKTDSAEGIEAASKREQYEMSIWAGMGLGGVLAGIGGGEKTIGKTRAASGFHGLEQPLATLSRFSQLFGKKWNEEERTKAQKLMVTQFKKLHPEFRLSLSEALAAAEA